MAKALFGDGPMALRPRLTAGLPFSVELLIRLCVQLKSRSVREQEDQRALAGNSEKANRTQTRSFVGRRAIAKQQPSSRIAGGRLSKLILTGPYDNCS